MSDSINPMEDGWGIHAADWNRVHRALTGFAVTDGLETVVIDGSTASANTLGVTSGSALVDGTEHTRGGDTGVSIREGDASPRWDVVAIDSNGDLTVIEGDPEPAESGGVTATRREAERPAPPDLSDETVTPLAFVWVGEETDTIVDDDVYDVRPPGNITVGALNGDDPDGYLTGSADVVHNDTQGGTSGNPHADSASSTALSNHTNAGNPHADSASDSDLSNHASTSDAHHTKTQPSDVDSQNWSDYEIQKDGTDGTGIINFKTS